MFAFFRLMKVFNVAYHFADIKAFFNVALHIPDVRYDLKKIKIIFFKMFKKLK